MLSLTPKITGLKDVAVDTNALVAQVDARDKWHAKVHGISSKLRASGYTSVYFDCVINETISILGRRTEEQGRPHDFIPTLSNLQNKVPKLRPRETGRPPKAERVVATMEKNMSLTVSRKTGKTMPKTIG